MEEIAPEDVGDDLSRFRPAGANQSKNAGDLSRKDRKRIVFDGRAHGQVLNAKNFPARRPQRPPGALAVELFGQIAPDHRADHLGPIQIFGGIGYHMFAVTQDRDPIRDLQSLLDGMGDEDNRYAAFAEPSNQREELMLFFGIGVPVGSSKMIICAL